MRPVPLAGLQQMCPGTSHPLPSCSPQKNERVLQMRQGAKNKTQKKSASRPEAASTAGGTSRKGCSGETRAAYVPWLPLETRL